MAKFYGIVGYSSIEEKEPGVWAEIGIVEKKYSGDILKNYRKFENTGEVNDDLTITNEISIIADPYATENFFNMKYFKFIFPKIGGIWKISNVDLADNPRLKLTLGGLYNGEQA